MKKTVLIGAALSALTLGAGMQAWAASLPNGLSANGLSANGLSANGLSANGLSANGFSANGLSANGLSANGRDNGTVGHVSAIVLGDGTIVELR